jgi:hypothetical protein
MIVAMPKLTEGMIAMSSSVAPISLANRARTRSDSSKKCSASTFHGRAFRIRPCRPASAALCSSGDIFAQSR